MKILFSVLLFIAAQNLWAQDKPTYEAKTERAECVSNAWNLRTNLITLEKLSPLWKILPYKNIETAFNKIPSQGSYTDLAGWSCGPNSLGRSFYLLGFPQPFQSFEKPEPLHDEKEEFDDDYPYVRFARTVPKTLGYYEGMTDAQSYFLTSALQLSMMPMHYGLSRGGADVGATPGVLRTFLERTRKELHTEHVMKNTFKEILPVITQAIDNGEAVIPLIIFGAFEWHYLNIIAYNSESEQVIILDTDKTFYVWSYSLLACLMRTGLNPNDSFLWNLPLPIITMAAHAWSGLGHFNVIRLKKAQNL